MYLFLIPFTHRHERLFHFLYKHVIAHEGYSSSDDGRLADKVVSYTKISTASAKHVDIRFKFICHYAQARVVQPSFFKSNDTMTYLLTKALPAPRISCLLGVYKLKLIQDDVEEEC